MAKASVATVEIRPEVVVPAVTEEQYTLVLNKDEAALLHRLFYSHLCFSTEFLNGKCANSIYRAIKGAAFPIAPPLDDDRTISLG